MLSGGLKWVQWVWGYTIGFGSGLCLPGFIFSLSRNVLCGVILSTSVVLLP